MVFVLCSCCIASCLVFKTFSSSSSSALCFSMSSCLSPSALCSNSRIRWNVFRELCWLPTPQTGVRGACPGARDPAAGPQRLPSAAPAACPWPPAGSGAVHTVRWTRCSGSSVEFSTCSLAFWVCSMVFCSCRKALCFYSVRIWLLKAMFWVSQVLQLILEQLLLSMQSCIVLFQLNGQVLHLEHLYDGFLIWLSPQRSSWWPATSFPQGVSKSAAGASPPPGSAWGAHTFSAPGVPSVAVGSGWLSLLPGLLRTQSFHLS